MDGVRYSIPSRLRKKDLLTIEEIRRIADCAENVRDKAFIWVYFDSMRRLGEILSLRIGDVEFDDLGAKLYVKGKVGPDQARITFSVPMLLAWLSIHPFRDDPEAPLWVTLDSKDRPKPLSYRCVHRMIVKCAKRAGIGKRVWPYLIRHSRITPASKVLPHSLLCAAAGWKQGSRMPSVYIHLAGEDVDEAHLVLDGVTKPERQEEQPRARICPRCRASNPPGSKFCGRCGAALDPRTAMELDRLRAKLDRLLDRLTEDPERLEKLVALIESIN